jgi:hypothetical protein
MSPRLGKVLLVHAGTFTMGCVEGRDDVVGGCDTDGTAEARPLTELGPVTAWLAEPASR